LREEIGFRIFTPMARITLADLCLQQGLPDRAMSLYRQALELAERLESPMLLQRALLALAAGCRTQGGIAEARSLLERAAGEAHQRGDSAAERAAREKLAELPAPKSEE
jgi:tetratricopeptide (TPR) repeat protein